jgi:hypothetical protein
LGAAPFPAGQGANQAAEAAGRASREWKLSALLSPDPAIDIERIAEFNLRNAGSARIDSIETKVSGAEEIRSIAALLPAGTNCYFEISPARASALLPVIRDVGARAKIRTGGVTPEAIPDTNTVASFIANCARAGVAFKATAGLHHPLRCVKPLTYEQGAPHATMHGFLNVFIAAALVYRHPEAGSEFRASLQLNATAPVLHFTNEAVTIEIPYTAANHPERDLGPGSDRNVSPATAGIPTAHIRRARRDFAISFGSCSFEEPISDLQELNLL